MVVFASSHPLILKLTKLGMLGGIPHMFLKFKLQNNWSKNVRAAGGGVRREGGGQNLPFLIDKGYRLSNSLLLPHKPWYIFPFRVLVFEPQRYTDVYLLIYLT